jgi:hypothetical protein
MVPTQLIKGFVICIKFGFFAEFGGNFWTGHWLTMRTENESYLLNGTS